MWYITYHKHVKSVYITKPTYVVWAVGNFHL